MIGDQILGWVLTRAGRCAEGDRYATRSLRLGTRDALMLFQAGMAASCAGHADAARQRLSRRPRPEPGLLRALGPGRPARAGGALVSRRGVLVAVVALAALLVGAAAQASAHPLGNFTVNSYLRVEASGGQLYLRQVVDMAEIPTFRERSTVRGGRRPAALRRRAGRRAGLARSTSRSTAAGPTVVPISQTASFRPGAGGLQVLRYSAWYRATGVGAAAGSAHRLSVDVSTYAGRIGWHELRGAHLERGEADRLHRRPRRTWPTSCAPTPAAC